MKLTYDIKNLYVGNIMEVYNIGKNVNNDLLFETKFIIEEIDRNQKKFHEVFTDSKIEIQNNETCYPDGKSILINLESIINYLNQDDISLGYINKFRILEIYNLINFKIGLSNYKNLEKIKLFMNN
ncbi:MAG: hypothetical protein ACK5HP_04970 [Bacilli bacterium]